MMSKLNNKEKQILEAFKDQIHKQFPEQVSEIRIYGSQARGDATDDSDIDVLVITHSDDWRLGDAIRRIGYELDAEIDYRLSIQVIPARHMNYLAENQFTFYRNVTREGVAI